MSNNLKRNSDFIFLYEAIQCNPNGDPDQENKPRIDSDTKTNLVTDVRIKRYIRDYLKSINENIFVDTEGGYKVKPIDKLFSQITKLADEDIKTWQQTIDVEDQKKLTKSDILNVIKKGSSNDAQEDEQTEQSKKSNPKADNFLELLIKNYYTDIRMFGGSFAISGLSKTYTGPIQLTWGYSLNKVKLIESDTIVTIMNDNNSTFGKDYRLYYSLIAFYGTINKNAASITNLTEDDKKLFAKSLWNSISANPTRSKLNQYPKLYVELEYNENFGNGQFGDLRNYITAKPKENLNYEEVRRISDLEIDLNKLTDLIKTDQNKKPEEQKISKIYQIHTDDLKLNLDKYENYFI